MNKVKKFDQYSLANPEFVGLQRKFTAFTSVLTLKEIEASVSAYRASVETISKHLEVTYGETTKHSASRLNSERIAAFVALRDAVKPLCTQGDTAKESIGKMYLVYLEAGIWGKKQNVVTDVIGAAISALRARPAEELATAGIETWLVTLENKQNAYLEASRTRDKERGAHVEELTLRYRKDCIAKFANLTQHAYILGLNTGDEGCASFIEQVNGEIALCKEKRKMAKTVAKNASENATDSTKESVATEAAKTETASETAKSETVAETLKAVA